MLILRHCLLTIFAGLQNNQKNQKLWHDIDGMNIIFDIISISKDDYYQYNTHQIERQNNLVCVWLLYGILDYDIDFNTSWNIMINSNIENNLVNERVNLPIIPNIIPENCFEVSTLPLPNLPYYYSKDLCKGNEIYFS